MNCPEAQSLLSPHLDSELDLLRSVDLEQHLQTCPDCRRNAQQTKAARAAVREQATYFAAPDALRDKIMATLPAAKRTATTPAWFNCVCRVCLAGDRDLECVLESTDHGFK